LNLDNISNAVGMKFFPGSFNPPHKGHIEIAQILTARYVPGSGYIPDPIFSICANPPHKLQLTITEMMRRKKLLPNNPVLFTKDDPLFIDKARKFPKSSFIVGADTLLRLLDPQWGPVPGPMLSEFDRLGTSWFVFGREIDGKWVSAAEAINKALDIIATRFSGTAFTAIPVDGRWDVSSSDIRRTSGVTTGRMQCSEPNVSTLPRSEKPV
jgi:hypothetical protein